MWKKEKKQETQEVSPEKEEGRDLYEWAQALVCSVLAVVLLFTFVIRLIGVDGHSMVPTLQDGDRLLVLNAMLDNDYGYGDIVVLRKDTFLEEPIVKRVIATEGQTVDIDFGLRRRLCGRGAAGGGLYQRAHLCGGGDGISPDGAGGLHFRHGRQPKPLQRQPQQRPWHGGHPVCHRQGGVPAVSRRGRGHWAAGLRPHRPHCGDRLSHGDSFLRRIDWAPPAGAA